MSFARTSAVTGVLVALLVGASTLLAQSPHRIRVALVDALSAPDARAEILRFGAPTRRDVILLRADAASPADLAAALAAYRLIQRRTPTRAGLTSRTTITATGSGGPSAEALRRAAEMLRSVQRATESRIGNLGRGRWEEFDIAP